MKRAGWQARGACALLVLAGAVTAADAPAEEGAHPGAAAEVLRLAFAMRYGSDTISEVELIIRDRHGSERHRLFEVATKSIDGRLHAVGRLIAPDYLRGMAIMNVENADRSSDTFVYLPSMARTRRITTAQRTDGFLGSDLTYEDMGRPRVEDFDVESRGIEQIGGEKTLLVRARPRSWSGYAHVDFLVASVDRAILEARYYKAGQPEPYRIIETPRASFQTGEGYVLPTRLRVSNRIRGTTTEVVIRNLVVNPDVEDREFSPWMLERGARSLAGSSAP